MMRLYALKKRIKEIGWVKTLLIIIGCLLGFTYVIGLIEQIFSKKVISGSISFTIDPIKVFGMAFSTPATFVLLLLIIAGVAIFCSMYGISQKRLGGIKDTTLGSAGFMDDREVKAVFDWGRIDQMKGPILGKYKGKFLSVPIKREFEHSMPNKNILLVGIPGAGKTTSTIDPMVYQAINRGESVVVTDVKGDVYEATFTVALRAGYKVYVFNTDNCSTSDGWNILADVGIDINLAQEMANCILKNTLDYEKKAPEQYFEDGMFNLLTALILYVNHEAMVEQQRCEENGTVYDDNPYDGFGTIGRLYDILLGIKYKGEGIDVRPDKYGNITEITTYDKIKSLFKGIEPKKGSNKIHPAYQSWLVFESTQAKNRDGFIASLGTRLRMLQDEEARILLGKNDIDLSLPGKEKTIIYVNKPEGDSTHTMMTASFFSMMFFSLTKTASRSPGRKLPIPVNMILDEFANIGKIPNFERKPATVRSQGISLVISIQTLSQLSRMYPDNEWVSIKAMCAITMLLASGDDHVTNEEFSKTSGVTTVNTKQTRVQRSTFMPLELIDTYSDCVGQQQRAVLTSDEVRRMKLTQILVTPANHNQIIIDKILYTDLPLSRYAIPVNINNHRENLDQYAYLINEREDAVTSGYIFAGNGEIGYYRKADLLAECKENRSGSIESLMSGDVTGGNDYISGTIFEEEEITETESESDKTDPTMNEEAENIKNVFDLFDQISEF